MPDDWFPIKVQTRFPSILSSADTFRSLRSDPPNADPGQLDTDLCHANVMEPLNITAPVPESTWEKIVA